MAVTYSWKITALRKQDTTDLQNVIVHCRWTLTGTDEDGNTGEFQGATPLPMSSVDPNNFIAYENLTETIVVGWLENAVNLNHPKEQIAKQINRKKNPQVDVDEKNLPWAPPSTEGSAPAV